MNEKLSINQVCEIRPWLEKRFKILSETPEWKAQERQYLFVVTSVLQMVSKPNTGRYVNEDIGSPRRMVVSEPNTRQCANKNIGPWGGIRRHKTLCQQGHCPFKTSRGSWGWRMWIRAKHETAC